MVIRSPVSRSIYAEDLWGGGQPGNTWFVTTTGDDEFGTGAGWDTAFASIQAAHDAAAVGDRIYVARGEYDENVTITKTGLTIIGAGPRHTVRVTGLQTNGTAITIDGTTARVDDVQLVNLNLEGRGTGSGVHIDGQTRRITFVGCRFDGGATGVCSLIESNGSGLHVVDTEFHDCLFEQAPTGLKVIHTAGANPTTRLLVKDSRFKHIATACVNVESMRSLELVNCLFGNEENATEPTDYILANVASTTGLVTGCVFADSAFSAAKMTIAAGVIWVGNYAEDGVSAARPA